MGDTGEMIRKEHCIGEIELIEKMGVNFAFGGDVDSAYDNGDYYAKERGNSDYHGDQS